MNRKATLHLQLVKHVISLISLQLKTKMHACFDPVLCQNHPKAEASRACLSLQHEVKSCFAVCSCLYGRHKYTKSLPHSFLACGQGVL